MYRRYQSSTGGRIVTRRLQCLSGFADDTAEIDSSLILPRDQLEQVQIQAQTLMLERCSSPRMLNPTQRPTLAKINEGQAPSKPSDGALKEGLSTPETDAGQADMNNLAIIADQMATYSPRRGLEPSVLQKVIGRCGGSSGLRVVVAMGHWSDLIGSHEANAAVVKSLLYNGVNDIYCLPISTGGRGWLDSFRTLFYDDTSVESVILDVRHPLGANMLLSVPVLVAKTSRSAAFEGQAILQPQNLKLSDGLLGNSYGLGQGIRELAEMGMSTIYLGLGANSGILDCGVGLAQALGVEFLDAEGNVLANSSNVCSKVAGVDLSNLDPLLRDCKIVVGYESPLPLLGHTNVVNVGLADPALQEEWIRNVNNLTAVVGQACQNQTSASLEGSGAGGGAAYMLSVLLVCELKPGLEVLAETAALERRIAAADLLLTGAREVNPASTEMPVELSKLALRNNTKAIVYTGQSSPLLVQAPDVGIDCIMPLPEGHELVTDRDIVDSLIHQVTRNIRLLRIGGEI